ncbi:hypothetical protein PTSG_10802 [Salpingoeca rosetta]|uniref:RNA polymerase Rpb4/RPC9 core domain-containing protein n=1 Tax=Salpingoeca rosetta (strain ATCC 50818 / BSB-021) TaxID=946362 RepID=F2UPY9_SALR5|nr:uncharacterized protein PTSG_10802 [Salpingoeca rosetta]EGD79819.1 hypothetical protein PTSG_10802 [Salpingoeca rosetta]|eukprot:XP_004988767.1 hypothetical protein PTSG_10802 [Salpingoeca rosetta]
MSMAARGVDAKKSVVEDANSLEFFEDFEQVSTVPLLLSEVEKILEARKDLQLREDPDAAMSAEFTKTLDYAQRFGHSRSYEADEALRSIMEELRTQTPDMEKRLHKFEEVQLINLAPETVEEAKALIPTLVRVDDDILENVLQQIMAFRSFAT